MPPKISIIMPVYNADKYLPISIGSVIAQSAVNWELICFDDASEDTSLSTLREYALKDKRIKIIHSDVNVKQGGGRNRALREASGEYVMFLDADDFLRIDAVEICTAFITHEKVDMVLFDSFNWMFNSEIQQENRTEYNRYDNLKYTRGENVRKHIVRNPKPIWTGCYLRETIIKRDLFFPEKVFYEDNAVALAIQLSASNPIMIEKALYGYRVDNPSVTRSINNYRFFNRIESAAILKLHLRRLGLYDKYRDEIDFLLINQYYIHTIFGCIYRFDRVPMKRLRYVRATIKKFIPRFKENKYYKNMSLKMKIKVFTHANFPRLIKTLSRIKNKFV